jgi:hypothetical protein
MVHFIDHRLFENQGAPCFVSRRFGLLAVPCKLLQPQRQYDLLCELLDDAHVMGRAMGTTVVVGDPQRALDTTLAVSKRRDQFLEN